MHELKLTTVKVLKKLYDYEFRVKTVQGGLNFQRLVNRSMDLYLKDEEFRKKLDEYKELQVSGSQF
jgi:hypothetical protein